ncbi:MAG TPA: hypothetical protein VM120_09845 [Bryobacteraceae bacterium]|nr:hypothetical protein [Bryobacteraceae bacterium]
MSVRNSRPGWRSRNADVIAAAVIAGFVVVGSAVATLVREPALIFRSHLLREQVRPGVHKIRQGIQEELHRNHNQWREESGRVKCGLQRFRAGIQNEIDNKFRAPFPKSSPLQRD